MNANNFFAKSPTWYATILKITPIHILSKYFPSLLCRIFYFYPNERIIEYPFVHENLPIGNKGRVLDIGSGTSLLPFELASKGYKVWSLDIKRRYLPFIKYRNTTIVENDICNAPFPDNYFDYIISISVFEHIGFSEKPPNYNKDYDAMREVLRMLKPGGYLLITVPFGVMGHYPTKENPITRVYDDARLNTLLKEFIEINTIYAVLGKDGWFISTKQNAHSINSIIRAKQIGKWLNAYSIALIKAKKLDY